MSPADENSANGSSDPALPSAVSPADRPRASLAPMTDVTPATDRPPASLIPAADLLPVDLSPPDLAPAVIADRLHSAAIHLLRRLRIEDAASGLTAPRLSALSVIVFGGPLTLGALAAAEQVRPPTMTRLVGALERGGLVTREADPKDGRQVLLRATPAGRRLLEEGRARRTATLAHRLAALSPADLATLGRAASLLEALARPPG